MNAPFTPAQVTAGKTVPVLESGIPAILQEISAMNEARAVAVLTQLYDGAHEPEKSALAIAIGAIHAFPPRSIDSQEFHRLGDGGWGLLRGVSGRRASLEPTGIGDDPRFVKPTNSLGARVPGFESEADHDT